MRFYAVIFILIISRGILFANMEPPTASVAAASKKEKEPDMFSDDDETDTITYQKFIIRNSQRYYDEKSGKEKHRPLRADVRHLNRKANFKKQGPYQLADITLAKKQLNETGLFKGEIKAEEGTEDGAAVMFLEVTEINPAQPLFKTEVFMDNGVLSFGQWLGYRDININGRGDQAYLKLAAFDLTGAEAGYDFGRLWLMGGFLVNDAAFQKPLIEENAVGYGEGGFRLGRWFEMGVNGLYLFDLRRDFVSLVNRYEFGDRHRPGMSFVWGNAVMTHTIGLSDGFSAFFGGGTILGEVFWQPLLSIVMSAALEGGYGPSTAQGGPGFLTAMIRYDPFTPRGFYTKSYANRSLLSAYYYLTGSLALPIHILFTGWSLKGAFTFGEKYGDTLDPINFQNFSYGGGFTLAWKTPLDWRGVLDAYFSTDGMAFSVGLNM